jgi:hypothetical protein
MEIIRMSQQRGAQIGAAIPNAANDFSQLDFSSSIPGFL